MGEMLNGFGNDWREAEAYSGGSKPEKLPTGGYVLKIIGCKITKTNSGFPKLVFAFDIVEGEYAGYFAKRLEYAREFDAEAKTKGVFDLFLPQKGNGTPEETKKYKRSLNSLKGAVTAINESNPYSPPINIESAIDINVFVGKLVGGVFGDVEWQMDGRSGMTTKCRWFTSAEKIRKGEFEIPDPKYRQQSTLPTVSTPQAPSLADMGFNPTDFSDGDLPF